MNKQNSHNLPAMMAALLAITMAACSDPVEPPMHAEPAGAELVMGGAVIASYNGATRTWTGELEVEVGEETPHITVRFVDADGDALTFDDDFYLEVDIEDTSIADFEQDTPGEFGGHLHGEMEGETDVTFKLMHGQVGSGHSDFTTAPVHAHVEAAAG